MMGSLEVTEARQKNVPITWKRQFQGREKFAETGLKDVVDHNLLFWHETFGFPGALNDIHKWEHLSIFESVINGEHEKLDFYFVINDQVVSKSILSC